MKPQPLKETIATQSCECGETTHENHDTYWFEVKDVRAAVGWFKEKFSKRHRCYLRQRLQKQSFTKFLEHKRRDEQLKMAFKAGYASGIKNMRTEILIHIDEAFEDVIK